MPREVFDPAYKEKNESASQWTILVNVVRKLRKLCPWDHSQTHVSLRHLMIEEAYETIEAIDSGDMKELRTELGDLLFQVILHSVIAEESEHFDLADLLKAVTDKMVRRHPHVFDSLQVKDMQEILRNWEAFKAKEDRKERSILGGVPISLPALLSAHRMQEKAASAGFDFPDQESTWEKVEEEIREFRAAASDEERENEFGDLLFSLVNYARKNRISPEDALRNANQRFRSRITYMEENVPDMSAASPEELDQHWEASKRQ